VIDTGVHNKQAKGPVERRGRWPRLPLSSWAERSALPVIWIIVIVGFGIARPHTFLTGENFAAILGTQAVLVVLTLGLLIPLTAGDYDLSVAYTLTLAGMTVGILNVNEHWAIGFAILAAVGVGAVVGFINGALVVVLSIDPFIVTLGTGTFIGGVVLWISGSNTISGIASSLVNPVVADTFLGVPLEFYFGLALCVMLWYLFEYTPIGRRLLFVGRGRTVASLSGIHVSRIRWGALVASGVLSAVAGVLYVGTTGSADPTSGITYLLPAFAAAFLGATTIVPGRFNPWGTVIAVYFLETGIAGLQLVGVESFVQNLFYGGALVAAVGLSQSARRRQNRRRDQS
jgi:ribose transport system permease protein